MSAGLPDPGAMPSRPTRQSSGRSGLIVWGTALSGVLVIVLAVALFFKQSEDDFQMRLDDRTLQLLRSMEDALALGPSTGGLAARAEPLRLIVGALQQQRVIVGAEVRLGQDVVLFGYAPRDALIKTVASERIVDPAGQKGLVVAAYFDSGSAYSTHNTLILCLGAITLLVFGYFLYRILSTRLSASWGQRIETAALDAKGKGPLRFDQSRNDPFGWVSRFIRALEVGKSTQQQLDAAVREQRGAEERAAEALVALERAQDRLVQSERLTALGQIAAGVVHEIRNPLNFINNFSETSVELLAELKGAIAAHLQSNDVAVREQISALMAHLSSDLETIARHGKRADSIVKNTLKLSRTDRGDAVSADINGLLGEAADLAYHGERAHDRRLRVQFETRLESDLKHVRVVAQDLMRVFINLYSNAIHATQSRRLQAVEGDYHATITTTSRAVDGGVEIRIRDNGAGISAADRKNVFVPFFTTKPAAQGTGLGLSICHEIITKQHAGRIDVESTEGEFTEFVLWLPDPATATSTQT